MPKMQGGGSLYPFADTEFHVSGEQEFFGVKKHYELDGWIGIHATIDGEDAKYNDDRYIKNQFYNPNQLRVYVRNKLAMLAFLSKILRRCECRIHREEKQEFVPSEKRLHF